MNLSQKLEQISITGFLLLMLIAIGSGIGLLFVYVESRNSTIFIIALILFIGGTFIPMIELLLISQYSSSKESPVFIFSADKNGEAEIQEKLAEITDKESLPFKQEHKYSY
ncbi:MAG: hypothetical protein GF308_14440 [Candidatus Heimdallarchaeota archaeon]|nr:hypothetical protein [Candidatus Heimdallarchaeota archaeon]